MKHLIFSFLALFSILSIAQNSPTLDLGNSGTKNYAKNPYGLTGKSGVTASSSSTLTINTTAPLYGKQDFAIDATASAQTYTWTVNTFDRTLKGQNCEAKFTFSGDASLYIAYVKQSTTKVAPDLNLTNESNSKSASINFPCGDLSLATTFVIESTGASAALIKVSGVYVGLNTNIGSPSISTDWIDAGAITIGAVTTAPTKGTTTTDRVIYRRIGQMAEVEYQFVQTTAGTAGSGEYLISLPAGLVVNTTLKPVFTATIGFGSDIASKPSLLGFGHISNSTDSRGILTCYLHSSTQFKCTGSVHYSTQDGWGSTYYSLTGPVAFGIKFSVPIQGSTSQTAIRIDQANYDWISFSPTSLNLGTPTFQSCRHKREGPDLLVSCVVTSTSAPGAEMRLGLPGSLITSTDSSKIPTNPAGAGTALPIGRVDRANGMGAYDTVVLAQPGKSYVNFGVGGSTLNSMSIASTSLVVSNETFTVTYRVPIEGWTENQNAPMLVGSATVKGSNTIRNLFSGFFGGSATDTTTACFVVGNCFLQGQTANVTSVSYTTSPFRYTLTVPSGQCAKPLICSWEGGGQSPNITGISNISTTTFSWTPSDGAGSGIAVFGTFNCSCDLY